MKNKIPEPNTYSKRTTIRAADLSLQVIRKIYPKNLRIDESKCNQGYMVHFEDCSHVFVDAPKGILPLDVVIKMLRKRGWKFSAGSFGSDGGNWFSHRRFQSVDAERHDDIEDALWALITALSKQESEDE